MDIPQVPDYELLAMTRRGPLTCDFAARHRLGGFSCIVRTLKPELASNPLAIAALIRQARIGLALRHRNIRKVIDARTHAAPFYLVMEQLCGDLLSQLIMRGMMPAAVVTTVTQQLADAVAEMHQAGYVHANIDPNNVLLKANGDAVLAGLDRAHRPGEAIIAPNSTAGPTPPVVREVLSDCTFASDWYAYGQMVVQLQFGPPTRVRCRRFDAKHRPALFADNVLRWAG